MKVILLRDVPKLGKKDEIKEVNQGYAHNLLIPRGFAKPASPGNIKQHEIKIKEKEVHKKVQEELINKTLENIKGKEIKMKVESNDEGHLYKAVHEKDLIDLIKNDLDIDVDQKNIKIGKQIKEVGEHNIDLVFGDKKATLKLIVD